jgi:hypothetical protein
MAWQDYLHIWIIDVGGQKGASIWGLGEKEEGDLELFVKKSVTKDTMKTKDNRLGGNFSYMKIDGQMVAINAMFSFDLAIRKGEANLASKDSEDHTIRNEDLTFYLSEPLEIGGVQVHAVRGGTEMFRRYVQVGNVAECCVQGITHKAGVIRADKMIQHRTIEEEAWGLSDMGIAFGHGTDGSSV